MSKGVFHFVFFPIITKPVLAFSLLVIFFSGCFLSPEARARDEFAKEKSRSYPFNGVSFIAKGYENKTLEITAGDIPEYSIPDAKQMLLSDKLTNDAKAAGFKEIHIEFLAGWRTPHYETTINLSEK